MYDQEGDRGQAYQYHYEVRPGLKNSPLFLFSISPFLCYFPYNFTFSLPFYESRQGSTCVPFSLMCDSSILISVFSHSDTRQLILMSSRGLEPTTWTLSSPTRPSNTLREQHSYSRSCSERPGLVFCHFRSVDVLPAS